MIHFKSNPDKWDLITDPNEVGAIHNAKIFLVDEMKGDPIKFDNIDGWYGLGPRREFTHDEYKRGGIVYTYKQNGNVSELVTAVNSCASKRIQ